MKTPADHTLTPALQGPEESHSPAQPVIHLLRTAGRFAPDHVFLHGPRNLVDRGFKEVKPVQSRGLTAAGPQPGSKIKANSMCPWGLLPGATRQRTRTRGLSLALLLKESNWTMC